MSERILWQAENVALPALDFAKVQSWIERVAESHNRVLGQVGYVFCDDPRILDVNRQFLGHDYFTDIITFDSCMGRLLRGDIYISLDTVRSNAAEVGVSCHRELMRVIVHGILHLCGIDDKAPGARAVMERHENEALALWDEMNAGGSDPDNLKGARE